MGRPYFHSWGWNPVSKLIMMPKDKIKVVLIYGPTGVSKTDTSLILADNIGEIISADSMQIYKDMDIGTAKITEEERAKVPHHMIDIIEAHEEFTALNFRERALELIQDFHNRGKIPFVVGGTGFYFKALMDGLFDGPGKDPELREKLEKECSDIGVEAFHNKLKEIDPQSAGKIHFNDVKRVIRALEVYYVTGQSMSEFWENQEKDEEYDYLKIGLTYDREKLYRRIEKRCDLMLDRGLLDEVQNLMERGLNLEHQSMQAIGYQQFYRYFKGEYDYDEALRLFKRDSRRLAKRQWTMFLRFENSHWFEPKEIDKMKSLIEEFVSK